MQKITAPTISTIDREEELDILPPPMNLSSSNVGNPTIAYGESGCKAAKQAKDEFKRHQRLLRWKVTEIPWNDREMTLYQHALNTWRSRNDSVIDQTRRDVFMMHCAIKSPGYDMRGQHNYHGSLAASILKKLHFMLDQYGPMYYRKKSWRHFGDSQNIPKASVLLHKNRLLIQLPKVQNGKDLSAEFLTQFLGISDVNRRHSTAHGIQVMINPILTDCGVWKHLQEIDRPVIPLGHRSALRSVADSGLAGDYGINLALGGHGNKHFLSQKMIDNRGANGHLSLHYLPATEDTPGGLLIGIEQTAPMDFASEICDATGRVYDNYGGESLNRERLNEYTVTGGIPWSAEDDSHQYCYKNNELRRQGPDRHNDAMFMHMSSEQLQHMFERYDEDNFDPTWLAEKPRGYFKISKLGHDRLNAEYERKARLSQVDSSPSRQTSNSISDYLFGRFWSAPTPEIDVTHSETEEQSLTEAIKMKIRQ